MSLFESFIRHRRLRILQRLSGRPHRKRLPNLEEIHSIGILLPPQTDDKDRQLINQFEYHMRKRAIQVETLTLPAPGSATLNRLGFPSHSVIASFVQQPFDLLILATANDDPAALYVAFQSQATLRVAYDDTRTLASPLGVKACDLFIRGHQPLDLSYFLIQLLTLLQNVNKPQLS